MLAGDSSANATVSSVCMTQAVTQPLRFTLHVLVPTHQLFSQTLPKKIRQLWRLIRFGSYLRSNVNNIRNVFEPNKPHVGYDIIIIATGYEPDSTVQEAQFRSLLKEEAQVVAVWLPISGGGPTLDTLRAYRLAKARIPDLDEQWKRGKKIAIILNAGEGRRDSPLTQSENNSRGAIRIGGQISRDNAQIPLTLLNITYAQNAIFAASNPDGQYLDVFYANQTYLPNTDISASPPRAPLVKFASIIQSPEQLTAETIQELGVYEVGADGHAIRNLPKGTFQSVEAARAWLKNVQEQGHKVAYSLGSHRIRRDFFQVLDTYFGGHLSDQSLSLQPPDIVITLLCIQNAYERAPADEWNAIASGADLWRVISHYAEPSFQMVLSRVPHHRSILDFYLSARVQFGENPKDWFGLFGIGKDVFWWRYRWPLSILNGQLLMLSDFSGEHTQVASNGRTIVRPTTSEDTQEAQILRQLHGISCPLANSIFGSVTVSASGVRSDTGKKVTFKDLRNGITIDGVFLQGSIVLNSQLPSGSRVMRSVVDHRQGELDAQNSFVERSSGDRLVARESLVYNVVNKNPLEAAGTTVADIFRPSIPEYRDRGLVPGQTRMWIDFRHDASQYDEAILPRNSYSFRQLREMRSDPTLDEEVRQRIQLELKMKQALLPDFQSSSQKTVLVVGSQGFLGKKIYKIFSKSFMRVIGTSYSKSTVYSYRLDATNEAEVKACIERFHPDIVIYAAGEANPKRAEEDSERAWMLNAGAMRLFAKYFSGHFIYISSDYVFDGRYPPYQTGDTPNPLNFYGQTKLDGEQETLNSFPKASVIRAGLLYGFNDVNDRSTFVSEIVHQLDQGDIVHVEDSQIRHPTLIDEVASLALSIAHQENTGIFHLSGEPLTKYEMARVIADVYYHMFPQSIQDNPFDRLLERLVPTVLVDMANRPHNAELVTSTPVVPFALGIRRAIRGLSNRLKGGSFSQTQKVFHEGSWVVRKEAYAQGREKLLREIEWLQNLPKHLQSHFPFILSSIITPEDVAYEMPFYDMPTLAQLIIEEEWTADQVQRRLKTILDFYVAGFSNVKREPAPPNYAANFLIQKIVDRLDETARLAPEVFPALISGDEISINGQCYRNIHIVLDIVKRNPGLLRKLQPPMFSFFHGDFHFDNMLTSKDDNFAFVLVDPRGDRLGDPLYDAAKLLHSIIGKYDILNYDLHRAFVSESQSGPSITMFYPTDRVAWKVYQTLEKGLAPLLYGCGFIDPFSMDDPYWLDRLAFTHAALFASDTAFHLKGDKKEERAIGIYATGVILLNEFLDFVQGRQDEYHGFRYPAQTLQGFPHLGSGLPGLLPPEIAEPTRDAFDALRDFLVQRDPLPANADAVVILGDDLTRVPKSASTILKGIRREHGLRVHYIVTSSGYKNILTSRGVTSSKIIVRDNAHNVEENAHLIYDALRDKDIHTVVVMHSPLLQRRTQVAMQKEFGPSVKVISYAPYIPSLDEPEFGWSIEEWMRRSLFVAVEETRYSLEDTALPVPILRAGLTITLALEKDTSIPIYMRRQIKAWTAAFQAALAKHEMFSPAAHLLSEEV